jgi:hypothetical protein
MAGVRDPLVLLPVPRGATPPRAILDFLHPGESKIALGGVAWSCLNLAGGRMGNFIFYFLFLNRFGFVYNGPRRTLPPLLLTSHVVEDAKSQFFGSKMISKQNDFKHS